MDRTLVGQTVNLVFSKVLSPVEWTTQMIITTEKLVSLASSFGVMHAPGVVDYMMVQVKSFVCREFMGNPEFEAKVEIFNPVSHQVTHTSWRIQKIDWNPKIE